MIGNKTRFTRGAGLTACVLLLVLSCASCNKEHTGRGRKISFEAKSKGYMTKSAVTKTSYAGEDETVDTKLKERIDWSQGDLIYIYCGSATNQGDGTHYAEYGVEKFSAESDAVSKATIQPTDFANSMEWGTGTHDFYAMYPSPRGHATNTFTEGTMVFTMPSAYPVAPKTAVVTRDEVNGIVNFKPDMDYAPMLAAQTGVSTGSGSVTLPFTPQFNAFEITIGKSTYTSINLSQFRIYGAAGDKLSGTFTVTPANYAAVASITDATNAVTLDLNGADADPTDDIVLNADYPTLKLTVLTLPQTYTEGITIEFTGDFDGEEQTRRLTLKTSGGDFVEFAPYKKYRITGLSFPVLVGTTIEDGISWDFGLEILDGVIWWIGAAMENHITWTDDIDINAYTELPDDVKWFEGSYIVNDFRWEELDHIALNDDSDAYLWRTQKLTRTVQAYNREGSAFSDVKASWSVTQEGRVIHLNQTTGEVTALGPGEATVTATVTPGDGSTPWTVSYKVYVNAPTGISLTAAKYFVSFKGTTDLTATVTFTAYGTISDYPADLLEWNTTASYYIPVSGDTTPAIATGKASGTATGNYKGASTLTVTVASKYADKLSASLENFLCVDYYGPGYVGPYYVSRGVLEKPLGSSNLTLTSGADPFELLKFYKNRGSVNELFPPSSGNTDVNYQRHYFNFNELGNYFSTGSLNNATYSGNIPTTSSYPIAYNYSSWVMDHRWLNQIIDYNRLGSLVNDTARCRYVNVTVDLTEATDIHGTDYSSLGTNTSTTVKGLLVFPDGGEFSIPSITDKSVFNSANAFTSVVTAQEIVDVCSGDYGCIFLPATAILLNGSQYIMQEGSWVLLVTNLQYNDVNCYYFLDGGTVMNTSFCNAYITSTIGNSKTKIHTPVHLVRVDD